MQKKSFLIIEKIEKYLKCPALALMGFKQRYKSAFRR